jgi:hypothetical protein
MDGDAPRPLIDPSFGGRVHNLYFQSLAGGEPAKLTFFSHDAFHPRSSPDGEWIAYISNKDGLPQLALLETCYGEQKTLRIVDGRWKRPMGVLALRTVDTTTGEVVASRIHLTASDGKFYRPRRVRAHEPNGRPGLSRGRHLQGRDAGGEDAHYSGEGLGVLV